MTTIDIGARLDREEPIDVNSRDDLDIVRDCRLDRRPIRCFRAPYSFEISEYAGEIGAKGTPTC